MLLGLLIACAVVWLLPAVVIVVTSLKPPGGLIGTNPLELPKSLRLDNYPDAWTQANFSQYMLDSAIICAIKVPLGVLVSAMTAFGLSRFHFRFRRALFLLVVAGAMVPLQIPLIPLFTTLIRVHLINSYVGLIAAYLAFSLPFQVIFLTTYFNQIPREVEDAARVDGCSPWRYFRSVLLPLSKPILVSLVILDLVGTWNEFPIALTVILDNDRWTCHWGCWHSRAPIPASSPSSARPWCSQRCRSWSST